MALELRTITDDEVAAYREAMITTFGDDSDGDPTGPDRTRALLDRSQAWVAVDGTSFVATAGTFNLEVGICGGTLPMAGLTMVTVRPTHRRRGLLRQLMRLHLDDARARGFAISGLWASEGSIYGRFGYGIAAESDSVEIDAADTVVVGGAAELDPIEWIEEPRAREALPAIYARATADRPGALRRSEVWWQHRRFLEASFIRGGASRRRHVLARRGDATVGYLVYRQRSGHDSGGRLTGKTEIIELIGVDPRAEASLWRFALGMDLFRTVTWWNAPTDDVLAWNVSDSRRVIRRRTDNLWLRIDDVPAALAARRYVTDGRLVLAVDDTTWQLVLDRGRGECTPARTTPELRLDRAALSSLYLGGVSATTLARAGRLTGDPGAIALADRVFSWPIAAWCPEIF